MPESPEVAALAGFLDANLTGRTLTAVDVLEFRAVKTRTRSPEILVGRAVDGVRRFGKHLSLAVGDAHLVVSLGRHGWMRWRPAASLDGSPDAGAPADAAVADGAPDDAAAAAGAPADAGVEPPALVALVFDGGTPEEVTVEVTDAGDWVSIGLSVVDDPHDVDDVARLGADPLDLRFDRAAFDRALGARRKQIKAILQEQESLAGIGNAYSDEILHAARLAPTRHAVSLELDERQLLFDSTVATMTEAMTTQRGVAIDQLKAAKVAAMTVHGRAGQPCPRCGAVIEDLAFGGTTAQWCPACQR